MAIDKKISTMWDWRSTSLQWLSSSRDLDLDLVPGHTAYRRASVIDLYLHTKCHWNRKNLLRTEVRTHVWTYLLTSSSSSSSIFLTWP